MILLISRAVQKGRCHKNKETKDYGFMTLHNYYYNKVFIARKTLGASAYMCGYSELFVFHSFKNNFLKTKKELYFSGFISILVRIDFKVPSYILVLQRA